MTIFGYLVGIIFWAFVVVFGIIGLGIVAALLARKPDDDEPGGGFG